MRWELKKGKLGDDIAVFYALENLGRQNNTQFELKMNNFDREIFELFHFDHISSTNKTAVDLTHLIKSTKGQCEYAIGTEGRFQGHFTYINLLLQFLQEMGYDPTLSLPLKTRFNPHAENVSCLIQFDGLTAKNQQRSLTGMEMRKLIPTTYACLGGTSSTKYLPGQTIFCPASEFIPRLLNCDVFLGSDSGLSHLAGALAINQKVFIKGSCFPCLRHYYTQSYRNCEVIQMNGKMFL